MLPNNTIPCLQPDILTYVFNFCCMNLVVACMLGSSNGSNSVSFI